MIGVVCLNPALDVTHHVAAVDWSGVNRPDGVYARPGGKGLNVARTLTAPGPATSAEASTSELWLVGAQNGPASVRLARAGGVNGLTPAFLRATEPSRRRVDVRRLRVQVETAGAHRHKVDERLIW